MDKTKYKVLVETLRNQILSGKYGVERPLPSVRALSRRHRVSSNTVSRAFSELAHLGLISGRHGSGTFVTRAGVSRKIGLIVPGVCYSEIFPPICKELSRLAQEEGYTLLLGDLASASHAERGRRAKDLARKYVGEGVAGVVFQPIEFLKDSDAVNREILSAFDAAGIPVVLVDDDIVAAPDRSRYDIVGINNFDAGRRLARHLAEAKARNVVFLTAAHSAYSVRSRVEGARAALAGGKGSLSEVDVDPADAAAVRRLLARRPKPEAVICRNDHHAVRLVATLRKLGKRVPEDLLVAGFNDVMYASILEPGLTSIHLPCEDIARQAFGFLCERIANPALPTRECNLSAPLVVRGTTGKG